ncbi:MAG: hypothetical protein ACXWUG_22305 [Polyangiales bacterium]
MRFALLLSLALVGCATSVDDLAVGRVTSKDSGKISSADAADASAPDTTTGSPDSTTTEDTSGGGDTGELDTGDLDTGDLDTGSEFPDTDPPDTGSTSADTGPVGSGTCMYCSTGVCPDPVAEEACFLDCFYKFYVDCTYDPSATPVCKCHD